MASAKQCDRCSAFYLQNENRMANHRVRGICFLSYIGDRIDAGVDLCDVCQEELARFLAGCELKEETSNV